MSASGSSRSSLMAAASCPGPRLYTPISVKEGFESERMAVKLREGAKEGSEVKREARDL